MSGPKPPPADLRSVVLRLALPVVLLFAALAPPAAAQAPEASEGPVLLDAGQSRLLARRMLAEERPEVALAIARALLAQDAADGEALLLLSAAMRGLGAHDDSRRTAQRAYRQGADADLRFEAAMLAGEGAFRAGAYTRSQIWLRRAAHAAPDDEARALARRGLSAARSQNPLRLHLGFGAGRTSNINDGSHLETVDLFGLPFRLTGVSRALSGTEFALDLGASYRLSRRARSQTSVSADLVFRGYELSPAAREQAPEARGRDFEYAAVEFGIVHRFAPAALTLPDHYEVSAAVGRTWYGRSLLGDHLRLGLARSVRIDARSDLRLALSAQRQLRRDRESRSSRSIGLRGEFGRSLEHGDRLILIASAQRTRSESDSIQNTSLRLGLHYQAGRPILGVRLGAGLDVEDRRYPAAPARQPDGRRDLRTGLLVSAVFERLSVRGFSPALNVRLSRTDSNIPVHERRALRADLSFQSTF